jgi:hypothetical protein
VSHKYTDICHVDYSSIRIVDIQNSVFPSSFSIRGSRHYLISCQHLQQLAHEKNENQFSLLCALCLSTVGIFAKVDASVRKTTNPNNPVHPVKKTQSLRAIKTIQSFICLVPYKFDYGKNIISGQVK